MKILHAFFIFFQVSSRLFPAKGFKIQPMMGCTSQLSVITQQISLKGEKVLFTIFFYEPAIRSL